MKTTEKLKRANQILDILYSESSTSLPEKLSWDQITKVCNWYYNKYHQSLPTPFDGYYLDHDRQIEILNQHTRWTRGVWHWYREIEIDPATGKLIPDPEWDTYKKMRDKFRRKILRKEMTYKDLQKWQAEQSKTLPLIKRYFDKEDISWMVFNYSPNSSKSYNIEEQPELQKFWRAYEEYKKNL